MVLKTYYIKDYNYNTIPVYGYSLSAYMKLYGKLHPISAKKHLNKFGDILSSHKLNFMYEDLKRYPIKCIWDTDCYILFCEEKDFLWKEEKHSAFRNCLYLVINTPRIWEELNV
jgi:hypothetical protein